MLSFLQRSLSRSFLAVLAFAAVSSAHAATNVLEYTYDAAGRITAIKRQASPGLLVSGFTPSSGAVGDSVTISGNNFDAVAANNTVKFNGVTASVTAASVSALTATVPTGATTGKVSVTVAAQTATSTQDFVVVVPGAPTITSFTPSIGPSLTSITVTGTNFNPAVGATTGTLNTSPVNIMNVTATQLGFSVPASTGSGRITITTSAGTAVSATDFIVPPGSLTAADIATTVRLVVDQPAKDLVIPNNNKAGLVLFDGAANDFLTLQFANLATSPTGSNIAYSVYKPDRTVLVSGTLLQANPSIHLPKLPVAGTYTVSFQPGVATFNANVKLESEAVVVVDGASVNFATAAPGQSLRFRANATAGQLLGLGFTSQLNSPAIANASTVNIFKPDGVALGSLSCLPANLGCDADLGPLVAGFYTFIWVSPATATTSFTATLSSDVTATLTPGTAYNLSLTRPGQNARLTFAAAVGDSTGLEIAGVSANPVTKILAYSVTRPDGAYITGGSTTTATQGGFVNLTNLPIAGNYAVFINPLNAATATGKVTVETGPTVVVDGAAVPFATTLNGETVRMVFQASVGQRMAVAIQNFAHATGSSASVTIYAPSGAAFSSGLCSIGFSGTCKTNLPVITTAGTYAIVVTPPATTGGPISGNLLLTSEASGTLTPDVSTTVDMSRAGRNARYTFTGTAGDYIGIELSAISQTVSGGSVSLFLYAPSGALVGQLGATVGTLLRSGALPATGTYTVVLDPQSGIPTTARLTVESGRTVVADGAVDSFTTTVVGEQVLYKFAGTVGQRLDLALGSIAYGAGGSGTMTITLYGPTGAAVAGFYGAPTYPGGNSKVALAPLTTAGTYSFVLPIPTNAPSSSGNVTLSTPFSDTLTIGGATMNFATTRNGRSVRYTFAGTANQLLKLNWTTFAYSPATATATLAILKPDGTSLYSANIAAGTSFVNVPTLPTTGNYVVVLDATTGVTMSGALSLVTR